MKKAFLIILIVAPVMTGCVIRTGYSPPYNASYVSSTGYGVGDYGLGFGTDNETTYGPGYGTIIMR